MKNLRNSLTLIILLLINSQCTGQLLMNTFADAKKLKANEQLFVDKPLKDLLKEIKPEIKMVTANPSENNTTRLGYLIFRFVDIETFDSLRSKGKYPLQITVFVKEPFIWDIQSRPEKIKFTWTKEDFERLKNLTVVGIRVFGEN